jgi:transposase
MSLSEVSNVLWRERRLLDLLVFKLEEKHFVLESGRTRWLTHATREVEKILEEIKRVELRRAVTVASSTGELRTSDAPSLREMAAIAPPPWDGIFAAHRDALLALTREIDAITESNRDLLERGRQAAREALASLGEIDVDAGDVGAPIPDGPRRLRSVDLPKDVRIRGAASP